MMASPVAPETIGLSPRARLIPLKGFSGCAVFLVDDGGDTYVRKFASSMDYNQRLYRQIDRQKNFCGMDGVQSARVRKTGELVSGIAFVDMDYVPGITAAETISTISLASVTHWVDLLALFGGRKPDGFVSPDLFHAKIQDLKEELVSRQIAEPAVEDALDRLARRSWTNIPGSPCHGDLTLENIIVHDGQLHLIDFLDSFADTWYLDIAKLLQDLIGGWSFRHAPMDRNLVLRLASLRHRLEQKLENQYPGCMAPIRDLYALNLLRILPYCSSSDERAFIEGRLSAALNKFL